MKITKTFLKFFIVFCMFHGLEKKNCLLITFQPIVVFEKKNCLFKKNVKLKKFKKGK